MTQIRYARFRGVAATCRFSVLARYDLRPTVQPRLVGLTRLPDQTGSVGSTTAVLQPAETCDGRMLHTRLSVTYGGAGQRALVSRYVTLCLLPVGAAPPWLVT